MGYDGDGYNCLSSSAFGMTMSCNGFLTARSLLLDCCLPGLYIAVERIGDISPSCDKRVIKKVISCVPLVCNCISIMYFHNRVIVKCNS